MTRCCRSGILLLVKFQNTVSTNLAARSRGAHHAQLHMQLSFYFQKITESLRKYFNLQFFKYLLFTSMNNRQKENWKLHFYKNFFPDSPKCVGKSVFDLVKGKTNFLKFLFIFKIKEGIPPWRRLQKCYLKMLFIKNTFYTK